MSFLQIKKLSTDLLITRRLKYSIWLACLYNIRNIQHNNNEYIEQSLQLKGCLKKLLKDNGLSPKIYKML